MSFTPEVISPEYSMRESRDCYAHVKNLKYPADRAAIARLKLAEKVVWYAAQDPHEHIEAGEDFASFWYWHYIVPLKMKRILFWFKFW